MIKLYPHQQEGLEQSQGQNRVAYYWDMGLGKTFAGSEKMKEFRNRVNLLICQKSKIQDWVEHFEKYYSHIIYDLTNKAELNEFINWDGSVIADIDFYRPRVGVINYELAWRRPELLNVKNFTLMLDESSLIQNPTAKQTKFILKLRPDNVILLSGTPTSGKYENLWTQAKLLGWDISKQLYDNTYIKWKKIDVRGVPIRIVDKNNPYKNVERLKKRFKDHGAQFLKTDEVMNLPEQTFIDIKVPNVLQYKKFMKNGIVEINGEEIIGDTVLTKRLRARQLCGVYNENKLQAFEDLVKSTNDRLIVFYNFNEELKTMIDLFHGERPITIINGQSKMLANYENFNDTITFVQYQAGAMGLNLQKANKIIYYSPPERCELYMQSQKRIHRIGQKKPCFYYRLTVENSIEEDIYKALALGIDYTDYLFEKENK